MIKKILFFDENVETFDMIMFTLAYFMIALIVYVIVC